MAREFQRRSRIRKFTFLGVIVALFTASLLFRQFVIEPKAYALQLRRQVQGEVEISSTAARLALLGSRGFASAVLWHLALEEQKRHRWNELEILINSITTLQPYFVTPWMFQSWNLSFNVAVECDLNRDKYYWFTRGMRVLAKGDRIHGNPGNPNMRFSLGQYAIRKIGLSDEQNAMRSLFDMSCIDPLQRDPDDFWKIDASGRRVVDLVKFRRFCQDHPRLVRRLRRRLWCYTPEKVLAWLKRNSGIPSRFDEGNIQDEVAQKTHLLPPRDQFPILPPPVDDGIPDYNSRDLDRDRESFDVFVMARAWYLYAQKPLPPLPPEPTLGVDDPPYDPMKYREPRMTTYLFRGWPARAQEYVAEELNKEGWFDEEGWIVTGWFGDESISVGGEPKYHSQRAWQKAFEDYEEYGLRLGILLPEKRRRELERLARQFSPYLPWESRKRSVSEDEEKPLKRPTLEELAKLPPEKRRAYKAFLRLENHYRMRIQSNYNGHYQQCKVERLPHVVQVRKMFFHADEGWFLRGDLTAVRLYPKALSLWLPIMIHYEEFGKLDNIVRDTTELEHRYLDHLEEEIRDGREICADPPLLYMSVAQFGNVGIIGAPKRAMLPALTYIPVRSAAEGGGKGYRLVVDIARDYWERVFPLRNKTGPLDWIYRFEPDKNDPSQRKALELAILGVTRGTHPVPFAATPYQRDLTLVAASLDFRENIDTSVWQPLIPTEAIVNARSEVYAQKRLRER